MVNIEKWKIILILLICLLAPIYALPNVLSADVLAKMPSWVPHKTVNLGLDLQGGSHLLLKVEMDEVIAERIDSTAASTRSLLRKERIRPAGLRKTRNGITFKLSETEEIKKVPSLLRRELDQGLLIDEDDGTITVEYTEQAIMEIKRSTIQQSIEIIRRRVDETGTREPTIQAQGEDRILVQLPGVENPERIKELLGRTARMTFHLVDMDVTPQQIAAGQVPSGSRVLPMADGGGNIAIRRRSLLSGEMLTDSQPSFDQYGESVVSFRFNSIGARKFGDITKENTGKLFAIVLDGEVVTAPRINEPITGGSGQISGNFTPQSANDLAILLRAGALPAPLTVAEERSVGPSLGADSVAAGKIASLVGLGGVLVFMLFAYGRFGFYADLALVMNMVFIIAALSLLQATLTLPGIAGIVLTIGMAVDANVLIFERIREEVAAGRSPIAAVDKGYGGAMSTIMDANLTTLIAAALLYVYGTGPVRGFAVTLTVGIVTSLFAAIYVTRLLVVFWLRRNRPDTLKI